MNRLLSVVSVAFSKPEHPFLAIGRAFNFRHLSRFLLRRCSLWVIHHLPEEEDEDDEEALAHVAVDSAENRFFKRIFFPSATAAPFHPFGFPSDTFALLFVISSRRKCVFFVAPFGSACNRYGWDRPPSATLQTIDHGGFSWLPESRHSRSILFSTPYSALVQTSA